MPLPARPLPPTVQEALQRGNKIEAIKRLREIEGLELKEAKEAVEAAEQGFPNQHGVRGPGEMQANNKLWLAVVAVLALLLAWLLLR